VQKMSEYEYVEGTESYAGICIDCGYVQYGCEPDAEKYTCEDCGKATVYGLEQALICGYLDIE